MFLKQTKKLMSQYRFKQYEKSTLSVKRLNALGKLKLVLEGRLFQCFDTVGLSGAKCILFA